MTSLCIVYVDVGVRSYDANRQCLYLKVEDGVVDNEVWNFNNWHRVHYRHFGLPQKEAVNAYFLNDSDETHLDWSFKVSYDTAKKMIKEIVGSDE